MIWKTIQFFVFLKTRKLAKAAYDSSDRLKPN